MDVMYAVRLGWVNVCLDAVAGTRWRSFTDCSIQHCHTWGRIETLL